MSWSYSGDPSSSELDLVRFEIGDTSSESPIFQNEEIEYVINDSDNMNQAFYKLFSSAANRFAKDIKRSLGPQSEDPTERLKFFQRKADEYKMKANSGGISIPCYAYPKIFKKGMQSNPPGSHKGVR